MQQSEITTTATENKPAKKKKTRFFETYISKVLKQVAPDHGITSNAKQQLNSAICHIANKISLTSTHLTQISKKKTLSEKEISNAVKIVFPGELSVNSITEGEQSVLKFTTEDENKNTSRQDKAGILFPPSITEKFLRNFGFSKCMITKNAPVFLAATLEYITQDILQLSADMTRENNRVRITIRDLELSVRTDPELTVLFSRCNLTFIGGGVVPAIHSSLLLKKNRKKKKGDAVDGTPKKHRFRPGTVAIREIKKFQKISDCLIFAKFPFERYTRSIISKYNSVTSKMKISKDLFIILQYFIEQYIVDLLRDANEAAIHCKRVKLMPDDIKFICKLRGYDLFSNETENGVDPRTSGDPILEIDFPDAEVLESDGED
jgi:histone H3/H4